MNPLYTKEEMNYILDDSQVKAVIAHVSVEPKLSEVKEQLKNLMLVIYTDAEDQECTWEHLMETNNNVWLSPFIDQEDLAVILYTSGTTGNQRVRCYHIGIWLRMQMPFQN